MCARHTGVRESHLVCVGSLKVGSWWYVRSYAAGGADENITGTGTQSQER